MRLQGVASTNRGQRNVNLPNIFGVAGALTNRQKVALISLITVAALALLIALDGRASTRKSVLPAQTTDAAVSLGDDSQSVAPAPAVDGSSADTADSGAINVDSSNVNVQFNSQSTTTSDGQTTTSNNLTVNGQKQPVKPSNKFRQSIKSSNGSASVNINISNSTSTGGGM